MTLAVLNGPVIAAGESLSDPIDCTSGEIVRLTMPADWTTGANLTFQVSTDGNGFNDLMTIEGEEITVVVKPGAGVVVHEPWTRSIAWLRFRSGTREHPVVQQERREFAIAIDTHDDVVSRAGTTRAQKRE